MLNKEQINFLLSKEYDDYQRASSFFYWLSFDHPGITYTQFLNKVKEKGKEDLLLEYLELPDELIKHNFQPTILKKLKK